MWKEETGLIAGEELWDVVSFLDSISSHTYIHIYI